MATVETVVDTDHVETQVNDAAKTGLCVSTAPTAKLHKTCTYCKRALLLAHWLEFRANGRRCESCDTTGEYGIFGGKVWVDADLVPHSCAGFKAEFGPEHIHPYDRPGAKIPDDMKSGPVLTFPKPAADPTSNGHAANGHVPLAPAPVKPTAPKASKPTASKGAVAVVPTAAETPAVLVPTTAPAGLPAEGSDQSVILRSLLGFDPVAFRTAIMKDVTDYVQTLLSVERDIIRQEAKEEATAEIMGRFKSGLFGDESA